MFQQRLGSRVGSSGAGERVDTLVGGVFAPQCESSQPSSVGGEANGWPLRDRGGRNGDATGLSIPRGMAQIVDVDKGEHVRVAEVRIGRRAPERERFLAMHGIKQLGFSAVEVALERVAPIDFLLSVDALAGRVFGRNYLSPSATRAWYEDPAWGTPLSTVIRVEGDLADLAWKNRDDQEVAGAANVNLLELAVAHAAFYVMTEQSLFGGFRVRAESGALVFGMDGLAPCLAADASRDRFLSSCRYI